MYIYTQWQYISDPLEMFDLIFGKQQQISFEI